MAWSVAVLGYRFHQLIFFIVGDIAYADAWLKEETGGYVTPLNESDGGAEYDKILNDFYDEIEPISRDVPYMVGPGKSLIALAVNMLTDIIVKEITRPTVTTAPISPYACPAS